METKLDLDQELETLLFAPDRRWRWPSLAGKRVLVLGMGGGCDVFSAYALAQSLATDPLHSGSHIVYGTSQSRVIEGKDRLVPVSPRIYRCAPGSVPEPLSPTNDGYYGSSGLALSLPRGPDGCPLVFVVDKQGRDKALLQQEAASLRFDVIVGVDTGGDSLTGGNDFAESKVCNGRDAQVLDVCSALARDGDISAFYHVVAGPGCDAESSYADLCRALKPKADGSRGGYAGYLDLEPHVPLLQELCQHLAGNRTPNLIARSFAGPLSPATWMRIARHGESQLIPRHWLQRALVFDSHHSAPH